MYLRLSKNDSVSKVIVICPRRASVRADGRYVLNLMELLGNVEDSLIKKSASEHTHRKRKIQVAEVREYNLICFAKGPCGEKIVNRPLITLESI